MNPYRHRRLFIGTGTLADGQQLDRATHCLCAGHVGCGDLADAFAIDIGCGDAGVERQACEDRSLGCGVEPVDVGGRVCFGVAKCSRLGKCLGKTGARRVHPRKDEVRGAVHDSHHPGNPVTRKGFPQRAQ